MCLWPTDRAALLHILRCCVSMIQVVYKRCFLFGFTFRGRSRHLWDLLSSDGDCFHDEYVVDTTTRQFVFVFFP